MDDRTNYIKDIKRIVVKVGSSTLTHTTGLLNLNRIEHLARQLSDIHNRGIDVILVSSGAIAAGIGKLALKSPPKTMPAKQAAAAVGQAILLQMYEKFFSEYGKTIGQILLTREDMNHSNRFLNAKNTFSTLLKQGVIPIVNENDAIATEEIKFGDNDTLSALVSKLISADLLILLSDIDGMYDCNPKTNQTAKLIPSISSITEEIKYYAGGAGSSFGTGGMSTKVSAAEIATNAGASMVIVNGSIPNIITDVLDCKNVGTLFKNQLKNK